MKIFVVGSTGRVGLALLEKLAQTDHQVISGARQPEKLPEYANTKAVAFDLLWTPSQMAEVIKQSQAEAIICVAGSGGRDLLKVDLFGTTNLMQAAEMAGIKRFVLLSTVFALQPEKWVGPGFTQLKDYYIAKHFADLYLVKNMALDYTILQPGSLTEEAGTGKIALNDEIAAANTIEDVAATLAEIISFDTTIGKVLTMHNGDLPIKEALKEI